MENMGLYEDIARRTDGDIYIGVVGPVRTGKSTFIKRFMETLVIPNIENVYSRERARDELPQSGSGKTVMTAEPKFVPEEAVQIKLGDARMNVRLIDSVGYMVAGALGATENGKPRMVVTPWFDHEVTMAEAAETGTQKVIREHSTIGLVVTCDGSVTDIPREEYLKAEERVIGELKEIGKPFLVIVNSVNPTSSQAVAIRDDIERRYGVTCLVLNCQTLGAVDIEAVIKAVLYEFPMRELAIFLPGWVDALPADHWLKSETYQVALEAAKGMEKIKGIDDAVRKMASGGHISFGKLEEIDLGEGKAVARFELPRELFYDILSEQSGFAIKSDADLPELLYTLARAKSEFDKFAPALADVRDKGYGIVVPAMDELELQEPEIVRQGGKFGVKLRASAPSIHMIRANIETEVSPAVGSEKQSEDLLSYLLKEFEGDSQKIWKSNIFGKSLHELVSEGLNAKLNHMPEDAQQKLRDSLERIINEGSGGLICIIL